jgi:hypothetical protein
MLKFEMAKYPRGRCFMQKPAMFTFSKEAGLKPGSRVSPSTVSAQVIHRLEDMLERAKIG